MTYLSYFLWKAGYCNADYDLICAAKALLDGLSQAPEQPKRWRPDEESVQALGRAIRGYGSQIETVPTKTFTECRAKFARIIRDQIPTSLKQIDSLHQSAP